MAKRKLNLPPAGYRQVQAGDVGRKDFMWWSAGIGWESMPQHAHHYRNEGETKLLSKHPDPATHELVWSWAAKREWYHASEIVVPIEPETEWRHPTEADEGATEFQVLAGDPERWDWAKSVDKKPLTRAGKGMFTWGHGDARLPAEKFRLRVKSKSQPTKMQRQKLLAEIASLIEELEG